MYVNGRIASLYKCPNLMRIVSASFCSTVTRFTSSSGEIEVSAHQCGKPFLREIENVLPGIDSTALIAIPTMQHAREDLVKIGDNIEDEKDRLLETFMTLPKRYVRNLLDQGYFADYVDPCSGLAMITKDSNKVYSASRWSATIVGV